MIGWKKLDFDREQWERDWITAHGAPWPYCADVARCSEPPLIYIGGSMSQRSAIRSCYLTLTEVGGYRAFCDWIMPGEETDVKWREFEQGIGHDYHTALAGPHATDVFEFDKGWLDKADALVLVLPAGKSAHIELGYMVGRGKPAFVLMEDEPERWDLMYRFATKVVRSHEELITELGKALSPKSTV